MNEMPINSKLFQEYSRKNDLFEKTRECLREYDGAVNCDKGGIPLNTFPMDSKFFEEYIQKNGLFEKAREGLRVCLEDWWKEEPDYFLERIGAPFEKVIKEYDFQNHTVAIKKSFFYEPPEDYLAVYISIRDEKGSYVGYYKVFFDFSFELIEDVLKTPHVITEGFHRK